ncbi:MAG: hypothetical protein AAGH38_08730 [Pseudomonadota bacterium]
MELREDVRVADFTEDEFILLEFQGRNGNVDSVALIFDTDAERAAIFDNPDYEISVTEFTDDLVYV